MLDPQLISFRKLQLIDLPLLQRWLNQAYVHEWYDKDKSNTLDEVNQKYGPEIRGEKPTDCYFALSAKLPVAYIQTYLVNDYPEYGKYLGYDRHTAGVDLFIGEPAFMGQGFGGKVLSLFLNQIVFMNPQVNTCVVGPEPKNIRAIKCYEKVGFKYVKTLQIPNDPQPTYLMEVKRTKMHTL